MSRLRLFDAFGVELEYMIVDRASLRARPIADRLLRENGRVVSELDRGPVSWSNELVSHVLELKTTEPATELAGLDDLFAHNVDEANRQLEPFGAALLGTGTHPFFDPERETVIWPGEYNKVYRAYDRIFGVRGHGWANLQSAHLNLPFFDDDEFGRLHAAVRLLLPILPALAASSPLLDGRRAGPLDARLHVYRHNQDRVPQLVGRVIPEPAFSEADYEVQIFAAIEAALRIHDPDDVLSKYFVNSRGAIARFDRGSIEIRVLDVQECPAADLAIIALVVAVLRALVDEEWGTHEEQRTWATDRLARLYDGCVRSAEHYEITDRGYLGAFGCSDSPAAAGDLWRDLFARLGPRVPAPHAPAIRHILEQGSLATRILNAVEDDPDHERVRAVYTELRRCLARNRMFTHS